MIKNLIFDVYGTLVSTGKGSVKATAKIFREFGMEENAEEIYKKWKKYHKLNTTEIKGFKTERDIFVEDLRCLFAEYGIEADPEKKIGPMLESLYGREIFGDVKNSLEQIINKYLILLVVRYWKKYDGFTHLKRYKNISLTSIFIRTSLN